MEELGLKFKRQASESGFCPFVSWPQMGVELKVCHRNVRRLKRSWIYKRKRGVSDKAKSKL